MDADLISFESMLAAKDAANWAFWTMVTTIISAIASIVVAVATLYALRVAWKGLHTWKDQSISVAKGEWIASLVDYASGISYLPPTINWENPNDKDHVEKVAGLLYECIKKWKILQVLLENNPKLKERFDEKYIQLWAMFGTEMHNNYMSGDINRDELKKFCIYLYNEKL